MVMYVWCRTSGPPAPSMTLQGLASTWISLKPRLAVKQALPALEALIWRWYSSQMAWEEEPAT